MRKAQKRTRDALVEAMGSRAISVVMVQDVRNFFEHCGYRRPVQLRMKRAVRAADRPRTGGFLVVLRAEVSSRLR